MGAAHDIKTITTPATMINDALYRMPLIIQYLGKIFLPFNLSVYPLQQDTVYYYGYIAIAVLVASALFYRQRNIKMIASGVLVFLLFLLPVLFLPRVITDLTFEYRLYLPMVGIFIILTQTTIIQNKLNDKQLLAGGILVVCLFAALNINYQKSFDNDITFWTQAVETAPHSAQANAMLATRATDENRAKQLFLTALALNPRQERLNFVYGVMLQSKDSVLASEKYFLMEKQISGYYACDYYLARVAMEKKDPKGAINYLQHYVQASSPSDTTYTTANDNLLLLYLDTDQDDKAEQQAKRMLDRGLSVPPSVRKYFHI